MRQLFVVLTAVATVLAGCEPVGIGAPSRPAASQVSDAGLPPPPGRTAQQRAARREYYRGPRGHEF